LSFVKATIKDAIALAEKLGAPLHPFYSYYFTTVSFEELVIFLGYLFKSKFDQEKQKITRKKIIIQSENKENTEKSE
jgi:hypothetical protein